MNKIKFVNQSDLYTATEEIWTKAKETFSGGGGGGSSIEVVQTTGTSTEAVMSQNAVTDALSNVATLDNTGKVPSSQLNSDVVEGYYGNGQFYTSPIADYIKIGSLYWTTKNIGANSVTGTGLYFQWGDTQGYTAAQCGSGSGQKYFDWADYKYNPSGDGSTMTKYNSTDGKTTLDLEDDAAHAVLGSSWRMPTYNEWTALSNAANKAWTTDYQGSGVEGLVLTDKTDSSKVLFFPGVNYLFQGQVYSTGNNDVCVLSSSIYPSNTIRNYALNVHPNLYNFVGDFTHRCGLQVRAVSSTEPYIEYKITPEAEKVYIDVSTNKMYRWNGSEYIQTSSVIEVVQKTGTSTTEVMSQNATTEELWNLTTMRERKTSFDLNILKQAVADQNLEKYGLRVGDYTTINRTRYVIAGLNCAKGYNLVSQNHVGLIVIPTDGGSVRWNASGNVYTGADNRGAGYLNSDLHYFLKNTVLPKAQTDLGSSNLISCYRWLTNGVNTTGYNKHGNNSGCSSSSIYCNEYISALSEMQVYGASIWGSSGHDNQSNSQLEVFSKFTPSYIFGGYFTWLSSIASNTEAVIVGTYGAAKPQELRYSAYASGLVLFH